MLTVLFSVVCERNVTFYFKLQFLIIKKKEKKKQNKNNQTKVREKKNK